LESHPYLFEMTDEILTVMLEFVRTLEVVNMRRIYFASKKDMKFGSKK
jgi:hypothetical protein